jgi:uncharacterized membrane protein YfcA
MPARIWILFIVGTIGCAIAGLLFLLLVDAAWLRWGFFGTFLLLAVALLLFGWLFDRRQEKRAALQEAALDA